MNAGTANAIRTRRAGRDDILIDYEHQSTLAEKNGKPAPAAGWFGDMEWREGQGMFAVNVRWTAAAAAMIGRGEYRFISPVFRFDSRTGEVLDIVSVGLTNQPGLSGLADLASATAHLVAANARLAATGDGHPRDTDRAIEVFNNNFGCFGIVHPDTKPAERAKLTAAQAARPERRPVTDLAKLPAGDAAKLQHLFPGVWD